MRSRVVSVFPVMGRDLSQYHIGTALSRSELKIGSRLAEMTAIEAETWSTFAALRGEPYPEREIDHAWRQILFCQHHDSITGTSNDQSYVDLMSHLHESLAEGTIARDRALAFLAGRVRTDAVAGKPVVVFNASSASRTDVATMAVSPPAPRHGK